MLWLCFSVTIAAFVKPCVWLRLCTKTVVILVFRCGFPLGFSYLRLLFKTVTPWATGAPDKHNCRHKMIVLHESLSYASGAESRLIQYVMNILKALQVLPTLLVTYSDCGAHFTLTLFFFFLCVHAATEYKWHMHSGSVLYLKPLENTWKWNKTHHILVCFFVKGRFKCVLHHLFSHNTSLSMWVHPLAFLFGADWNISQQLLDCCESLHKKSSSPSGLLIIS